MAKTLANPQDRAEIERRLAALTPDSVQRWGVMPVGGMLCHVDDSYLAVMGERDASPATLKLPMNPPRWLVKFVGLRLPIEWRPNLPTGETLRQGAGGTPPSEFSDDRARLEATLHRFCDCATLQAGHPFFGAMSRVDWMRWGYLHADHHLRQFSA